RKKGRKPYESQARAGGRASVAGSGTPDEVAERLARRTLAREAPEQAVEQLEDRVLVEVLRLQLVQAFPRASAAEKHVIASGRLADQRDLGDVRPRAAVRAAGDSEHDLVVLERGPLEDGLELVEQLRQVAPGLAHREPAARQRDARRRVQAQRLRARVEVEAVLGDRALDRGPRGRRDVREDQVLIRRDAQAAVVEPRERAKTSAETERVRVAHAAARQEQRQVLRAVLGARPAEAVAAARERHLAR